MFHRTLFPILLGGLAASAAGAAGSATSALTPDQYTAGAPVAVSIQVNPDGGTGAYAVEDTPPNGWTVSAVGQNGDFDATNGKVKWGPFFDDDARTLTYTATPPAGASGAATFSGVASFDGANVAIGGERAIEESTGGGGGGGSGGSGTARSTFSSSSYTPGVGVGVTIATTPAGGTATYAVEDSPPNGWTVSAVGQNGTFDATNRKVKWGPFFDDAARDLSYTATPPAGSTGTKSFQGTASFDGTAVGITGQRSLPQSAVTGPCVPSATRMCLNDGRFALTVSWATSNGGQGSGSVVQVPSTDSGIFYFFSANNWEMLVKVLNGCGINDKYWVFFAATTDVEFTLRVMDLESGLVKTYRNPLGRAANAVTDTDAFATCP